MRIPEVVALVVGTALLVSCSSPEAATPAASLSPAPATQTPAPEPTSTRTDTAAVPDDIDGAYLQAVMDDLDEALGTVYRDVAEAGALDEKYQAAMRLVYSTQAASDLITAFRRSVGVKGLARRPKNPRTSVIEVLEATPTCVYFTAERDLNPLLRTPIDPVQPYYLALGRGEPNELNPTAWILHMDTYFRDNRPPASVCEAGT